ncbi:cytochrome c [uncultured Tateyamaria sp.]|uniref:c-type cytochrome n=1 Tax=uncultured Tateyamaria sp. TaxID=455651 RepID=UPI002605CB9B|nr:cytochrome c [uncultured Tateyamaria sp.]
MRLSSLALATFGITAMTVAAFAASHANPALEGPVKARNAQMGMISYHTGLLGSMAKGETPYDTATATAAAENLAAAAEMNRAVLWVEGTEQGAVAGSRAKAEIWSDAAGFEEKAVGLETAAAAMVTAAGTDLEALRGAMKGVGDACGACHKPYRGPKN